MFSFLSSQFHWYGFFIGLAIVVVLEIFQQKIKDHHFLSKKSFIEKDFWKLAITTILFGIIGGRLWHMATDNQWQSFKLWEGGMSILGAILFGLLGLWWARKKWFSKLNFLVFTDALFFGLPVGQAIGRLGNWINQELYGLPTDLPWGIYINPENRIELFLTKTHFHPLFAYEALLMLGMFAVMWWAFKNKKIKLGEGNLTVFYLFFYTTIRFFLDFLRVQKNMTALGLGLNQVILLLLWLSGWILYFLWRRFSIQKKNLFQAGALSLLISGLLLVGIGGFSQKTNLRQQLLELPDHSVVDFEINEGMIDGKTIGNRIIKVEVVNTSASIAKGLGSRETLGQYQEEDREIDGMLFVFSKKTMPVFWMKDMKFKIDMIWLDGNKIIGLEREVPFPSLSDEQDSLKRYSPDKKIDFVLETRPFEF